MFIYTKLIINKNTFFFPNKNTFFFSNKKAFLLSSIILILTFLLFWTDTTSKFPGTIKIYDKKEILLFEFSNNFIKSNIPVRLENLPDYLKDAAVITEDSSFWSNPGFDVGAILRAIYFNIVGGREISGASTITQQLVRTTVFIDKPGFSRNYIKKIREIITAARLNLLFSKKSILESYLNSIYFGNGFYGVESASKGYFGKNVSTTSLAESVFLIGIVSSPEKYNPYTHYDEAKKRQEYILNLMFAKNKISKGQADTARNEIITIMKADPSIKAPHFVHYVKNSLDESGIKSKRGINVYTTLDYSEYEKAREITSFWVNKLGSEHNLSNASLVMLDNKSGAVRVMLGGIDYFDSKNSGEINMAIARRQPGSAIKPITYAASFEEGFTPATSLDDVQKVYPTKSGEGYSPRDYDNKFRGIVLAREALASSLNIPAVEMLSRIGLPKFIDTARNLGITTFDRADKYDLAITLGGGEVTLLELSNAYATFAREGQFIPTYSIESILEDSGKVLFKYKAPKPIPAFTKNHKQISYLISDILSDPRARMVSFGEKNPLVLSHKAAVKTGTTTDWHDIWTVGYTTDFTVGVWVGNNNNEPMRKVSGVLGAAPIWNQFFEGVLKGIPNKEFIKPEGIISRWICKDTGLLYSDNCLQKLNEIFILGTEPKQKSPSKTDINFSKNSYLNILDPKEKSVFVAKNRLIFECSASSDLVSIEWFVDGKSIGTGTSSPCELYWPSALGKHVLKAVGFIFGGSEIFSDIVNFEVIDENADN